MARSAEAAIYAFDKTLAHDLKDITVAAFERNNNRISSMKIDRNRDSMSGTELPTISRRFDTVPVATQNPIQTESNNRNAQSALSNPEETSNSNGMVV